MDINQRVENNKLKELINKLIEVKDDKELYSMYMKEIEKEIMYNVHFLVIGKFEENKETGIISKGNKISFPLLKIQTKDEYVLPVFTDWDEIYKWEEQSSADTKAIVLTLEDCVGIVNDGKEIGIAINPFSQNLFLSQGRIERLKSIKDQK